VASRIATGLTVLVIVFALLVTLGPVSVGIESDPKETPQRAATPFLQEGEGAPREFLYLDTVRTDAYLSQLKGGNETLRNVSDKLSTKAGGEIGAGAAKVTGEAAREQGLQRTVSPTSASNFYALSSMLESLGELPTLPSPQGEPRTQQESPRDTPPSQDLTRAAFGEIWESVEEADIVRFIARVRRPAFVRVYQALDAAPVKSSLGRLRTKLQAAVGVVPRLPLFVDAHLEAPSGGDTKTMRLVMPAQPSYLSAEPTLFTPRLTIVAKLIRRMDEDRTYGDLAFSDRFAPMIQIIPSRALKRLRTSKARLRRELAQLRDWPGPAAILLPIAIYK
jgi:hypothetical protein